MFIYSKYSKFGVEAPQKLVHLLANEGIKALCLIDEHGLGIPSFLQTCKKRNIHASIALPFESFIEGQEEKASGYFVTSSYSSYEKINSKIESIKQDFIPLVTSKELKEFSKENVYCLIRKDEYCYEYSFKTKIKVTPVVYVREQENASKEMIAINGISAEEAFLSPTSIIFVEGVSLPPQFFLEEYQAKHKFTDINSYKEKKEWLKRF